MEEGVRLARTGMLENFMSSDALNRETFKYCQYYNLQCQITEPEPFHKRVMICTYIVDLVLSTGL